MYLLVISHLSFRACRGISLLSATCHSEPVEESPCHEPLVIPNLLKNLLVIQNERSEVKNLLVIQNERSEVKNLLVMLNLFQHLNSCKKTKFKINFNLQKLVTSYRLRNEINNFIYNCQTELVEVKASNLIVIASEVRTWQSHKLHPEKQILTFLPN